MEDHSTEIMLFFFGSALLSGLEAMKTEKWRSYALWGLTALFLLCGVFWTSVQKLSPPATAFVTAIATSPEFWFVLFVLMVVWLAASGHRIIAPNKQAALPAEANATIKARLSVIESNIGQILERQTTHISTPELASDLHKAISAINADLTGQIAQQGKRFSAELSTAANGLRGGLADVNNRLVAHITEAQNLMSKEAQARESAINDVAQIAHKLGLQFQTSEISLNHLLFFAVNSVTVQFLDRVIAKSPLLHCKNVAQYNDLKELEQHRILLEAYVRNIPGWLGQASQIGKQALEVAKNAENEMERILLNSSERDRPANIDPFVFRRYVIAELQCQNLIAFLELERGNVAGHLTGQRDDLLNQQQLHQSAKKSANS